ncbi:MAG TPA: amino acid adenylation domain-containing protein, partial [Bacillota bacterium]|nr:amino acid adenylation domain-containing protein [Bacillota bacterium]
VLPDLRIQYKDFAVWQNHRLESGQIKSQEDYWRNLLSEELPSLTLPLDFQRPTRRCFVGNTLEFTLPEDLCRKLNAVAGERNVTPNTLFLSVYSLLLNQYSGQNDLIIGSLVAGRSHPDLEPIIGVFMNFLPVRIRIKSEIPFKEFLDQVRDLTLDIYAHQDYPFDAMVEQTGILVDPSRNPVFDTMLIFHNEFETAPDQEIDGLKFSRYPLNTNTSTLDLKLDLFPLSNGGQLCRIEYNTGLFKAATIQKMFDHFVHILGKVTEEKVWKLSELTLFNETERRELNAKRKLNATREPGLPVAVAATFTAEPITSYLKWWSVRFQEPIEVNFASYNQVFQELLDPGSLLSSNTGANILLVRFEDWLREDQSPEREKYRKLEQNYADLMEIIRNKPKTIPYFIGVFPVSTHLGLGPGLETYIEAMYDRWSSALAGLDNVYMIDFRPAAGLYQITDVFDPATDQAGHLPFSDEYYAAMGTMLARKIRSYRKPSFKVTVLDCDNTLWQGVCGEEGALGVKVTEPYQALQKLMLQKYNEGMLLAICSKNNEADVWEVFEKNEGMLLKAEHFAAWRINWQAKSQNIKELAAELNLGLDSFIFLDDSATECFEVMSNCSHVLTLRLPENPAAIPAFLRHAWAFDIFKVTEEDRNRTRMYQAEKKRKEAKEEEISLDHFLKSLGLKMSMNLVAKSQLDRVSQLTQRTNQFNLSTIRRTVKEIEGLLGTPGQKCWTIEVSDRFGEYGLVGVVITKEEGTNLFIDTFLLSCRVLARNIEHAILTLLKRYSCENGLHQMRVKFVESEKNQPFREFLEKSNWDPIEQGQGYIIYTMPVDKIPDSINFIECFYLKSLSAKEESPISHGKPIDPEPVHLLPETESPTGRFDFSGAPWEVLSPAEEGTLYHSVHLLPLKNHTGKMLLQLPVLSLEQRKITRGEYVAPENELEKKLVDIWQELLGAPNIGINDDFFALGGHSLKATTLISRIHKEFNVEVPMGEIFNSKTVRELAQYIRNARENKFSAIRPVAENEYYPVSSAQKRLFILNQIEGASTVYNQPAFYVIEGPLDRKRVENAFVRLLKRHETLRTSLEFIDGQLVQRVHSDVKFELPYSESETSLLPDIITRFIQPFALDRAPLFRAALVKVEPQKHILMMDMNHAITDGVSIRIMIRDLAALYHEQSLPELRIQYKDYAAWQSQAVAWQNHADAWQNHADAWQNADSGQNHEGLWESELLQKQEKYWLQRFSGELPVLNLPTDYPRPLTQSFEGKEITFTVETELTRRLSRLANENGATLYMVLLAAYNLLLAKYSGQADIIVGSPVAGRIHADLENLIGMFVNTLAMRNYPQDHQTFREFLAEVKNNSLQTYENQAYQFETLVEKVKVNRDLSRNPLFDTMFILQNLDEGFIESAELTIRPYEFENTTAKFDLTLTAMETAGEIRFTLGYCVKLFGEATIVRLAGHFVNILQIITASPDSRLFQIEIISPEEKARLLLDFNRTTVPYPATTIHQLFEAQVHKTPLNIAVVYHDNTITYQELNARSNCLAGILREKGVTPNSLIGLMLDRSPEMIIGIMGILKAGGAYLPIDPEYPADRIAFIIRDSQTGIILTSKKYLDKMSSSYLCLDLEAEDLWQGPELALENQATPADLAYVIYTSGSTGNPKGTLIPHRGVVNYITWADKMYLRGDSLTFPLYSSLSFDLTVTSIFAPLITGNKIIVYGESAPEIPLKKILEDDAVDIIKLTPTHLQLIKELNIKPTRIQRIIVGGEDLKTSLAKDILAVFGSRVEIYNEYGPTETTVGCMIYRYDPEQDRRISVPIGVPAQNTQIYILDKSLHPVAPGVVGEIYISGDGLARGYLNRPELTVEKFVVWAFRESPPEEGPPPVEGLPPVKRQPQRIYRTGDLARWLPHGNIEYLGRVDHQVKIRGFRIELGEIEARLLEHPQIKEAAVLARENDHGEKYLCAYVVSNEIIPTSAYKDFLADQLPDYMIPSYIVTLDKMPVTQNGKVDRKALSEPGLNRNSAMEYQPPENALEEKLVEIWKRVLGVEKVGVTTNFFDLGGHSLLAVKMEVELEKEGFLVEYSDIYKYQTVKDLASYLKKLENTTAILESEPMKLEQSLSPQAAVDQPPKKIMEVAAGLDQAPAALAGLKPTRKLLTEFEPFNDVFYQNCTFNALFPVIQHFHKDITPVLVNDIIVYEYDPFINEIPKGIRYLPMKSPKELLLDLGLGMNTRITCGDIVAETARALAEDRPVIIKVDCFYESIREDAYLKNHWMHDLLIYGYSQPEQLCHVIEHNFRDTLSYEKKTLSFSDLIKSYRGFQENFNQNGEYTTFMNFYRLDAPSLEQVGAMDKIGAPGRENIRIFAANLALKKENLNQGIESLRKYTAKLETLLDNQSFMTANMQDLMIMLNNVINAKYVEKYRIRKLFQDQPEAPAGIIKLLDQVTDGWNHFRAVSARSIYSNQYNPHRFAAAFEKLKGICELEHEYLAALLDLLNQA